MASFKGDGRYSGRHCNEDDAPSSSDESDEENVPRHLLHIRKHWKRHYEEDIEAAFHAYLRVGRALFGGAFHQLGTSEHFANFVFKYMQPGATLSKE
tara:strand:+ start:1115 stop:1405 length:291 start_codon:yes stop_codon:yes gene_type:complete